MLVIFFITFVTNKICYDLSCIFILAPLNHCYVLSDRKLKKFILRNIAIISNVKLDQVYSYAHKVDISYKQIDTCIRFSKGKKPD